MRRIEAFQTSANRAGPGEENRLFRAPRTPALCRSAAGLFGNLDDRAAWIGRGPALRDVRSGTFGDWRQELSSSAIPDAESYHHRKTPTSIFRFTRRPTPRLCECREFNRGLRDAADENSKDRRHLVLLSAPSVTSAVRFLASADPTDTAIGFRSQAAAGRARCSGPTPFRG